MSKKKTADVKELQTVINCIDCTAQMTFNQLIAIIEMMLAYLETPRGQGNVEALASALDCMFYLANSAAESIGLEAENVGCEYVDKARERRTAVAWRSHRRGNRGQVDYA